MGTATPAETALQAEVRQLRERIAELENERQAKQQQAEEQSRRLLAALQEEKGRLSAVIASIGDEVWFADAQKRFVLVNPAGAGEFHLNMAHQPAVEQVAAGLEVFRPDGSPRPVEEAPPLRALNGELIKSQEEIVRTPATGQLRHREVSAAPVRDTSGNIVGSVCVVRDVTERKRVEEAANANAARLEAALESMTDAVFISDAQGRLTHTNEAFATYHRFRNKEECSKSIADCPGTLTAFLSDGTPAPPDMWALPRALRGETVSNTEYTLQRKDTGETWVGSYSFGPIRGDDGTIAGAVVVARDITERKRAEEQISRNQMTFSELVERAPFGIYIIDSRFSIAHMNAASQTGAFQNVRPLIGRHFAEAMRILWPEPVAAEIIAHFRHTLETGEPYYSPRFINPRHDVEAVESYEWELHRMTLPDGQYGVICYYFDSTTLRQAEQALERVSRMKTEFLSRMSHELRTPLNAIVGYSQLLGEQSTGPLPAPYPRFVANIQEGARHLLAIVNDLLDISRIEAGHIDLNRESFHPADVLEEVLSVIAPLARIKNISIENEVRGGMWIRADRTRFKQVLYNLVSNAVKFTPENGRVWIAEASREDAAGFCVGDTGIGIPESELEAIFDEFHQVGTPGAAKEGAGLGLAITRRLVELHGGSICVESTIGQGSRFILSLGPHSLEDPDDGTAV